MPEILYQNDYPYESSITKTGDMHWTKFAEDTANKFLLNGSKQFIDDVKSKTKS